jgi:L-2-hydroxyglutarate oxidase LhgO
MGRGAGKGHAADGVSSMHTEVAIVGAGVVGLACAARIAREGHDVTLIERHEGIARETSSRNSGVIHAGIYYTPGSLKATSCVEGRALLYARCERDRVPHAKTGKIIVATETSEIAMLETLLSRARENGVPLELIDGAEVERREPRVRAVAGLVSPESGIVDVHALCASYAAEARAAGAQIVHRTSVVSILEERGDFRIGTESNDGDRFVLRARCVVNAAGLSADAIAAMAGLDVDALGWRLRFCKGDYFSIAARSLTRHLVYPVPVHAGLGVHVTIDLGGSFRAGPDVEYIDAPRYDVDPQKAAAFAAALQRYLRDIDPNDLAPDYAGVRPKLYGPGEAPRDFVLEERPCGLIHLIGIESPGLTASEALARRVVERLRS